MTDDYTLEHSIKVWDNRHGDHVYVGPDADGLDLVDLRYVNGDGRISARITIPREMVVMVSKAINELYGSKDA